MKGGVTLDDDKPTESGRRSLCFQLGAWLRQTFELIVVFLGPTALACLTPTALPLEMAVLS